MTRRQEGTEERVNRKHWKRTGSMVRDRKLNKRRKRGRWKTKRDLETKETEDNKRHSNVRAQLKQVQTETWRCGANKK